MSNPVTSTQTLELPEVLDLTAATPLTEQLVSLRGLDLSIDASRVTRLGGQCLQVLLSTIATWKVEGAKLDFVHLSGEFVEALRNFGIDPATLTTRELSQ